MKCKTSIKASQKNTNMRFNFLFVLVVLIIHANVVYGSLSKTLINMFSNGIKKNVHRAVSKRQIKQMENAVRSQNVIKSAQKWRGKTNVNVFKSKQEAYDAKLEVFQRHYDPVAKKNVFLDAAIDNSDQWLERSKVFARHQTSIKGCKPKRFIRSCTGYTKHMSVQDKRHVHQWSECVGGKKCLKKEFNDAMTYFHDDPFTPARFRELREGLYEGAARSRKNWAKSKQNVKEAEDKLKNLNKLKRASTDRTEEGLNNFKKQIKEAQDNLEKAKNLEKKAKKDMQNMNEAVWQTSHRNTAIDTQDGVGIGMVGMTALSNPISLPMHYLKGFVENTRAMTYLRKQNAALCFGCSWKYAFRTRVADGARGFYKSLKNSFERATTTSYFDSTSDEAACQRSVVSKWFKTVYFIEC